MPDHDMPILGQDRPARRVERPAGLSPKDVTARLLDLSTRLLRFEHVSEDELADFARERDALMTDTTDLSEAATALYESVTNDYAMSDAERAVLVAGLIALDESERCRRVVAEEGPVTKDRFGQWVRHPAAVHGRDCRTQFVQCLRQLGLADKYERDARGGSDD